MSNTKHNVAIIGTGIGQEHMQAYLALTDRYNVMILCDIDKARAEQVRGAHNIEIETDFDKVLDNPDIDIIDICLPPHLHFDMSMKALAAGKHVVCEKPLVNSLRDADLLIAQCEKYDRILTPVFQYRFGPGMAKLQALIESGFAGKPFVASIETHWNRTSQYYNNPWRGTWKGEQGGAVLGHAIHNHDLLCAAFGPIARLSAFVSTRVNDIEVEDCAVISFEMENGALATSSITLGAANDTTRLRFCFENLTAESGDLAYKPAEGNWTFAARDPDKQGELEAILAQNLKVKSGFAGFFEALAERLDQRGNNSVSIADGRRSLELVTAIYQSARESKPIDMPILKDGKYYSGWTPNV